MKPARVLCKDLFYEACDLMAGLRDQNIALECIREEYWHSALCSWKDL